MKDLDERLDRLVSEATRAARTPEPAVILRRGRRLRRRRLAAAGLAAVALAGLAVQTLRPFHGGSPRPVTPPPADQPAYPRMFGYWFGRADATVYLEERVTPAERAAVRAAIERLPFVDQATYESRAQAYERFLEQFAGEPDVLATESLNTMPESFQVRLDAPELVRDLNHALCPVGRNGRRRCLGGVDLVSSSTALLAGQLLSPYWLDRADATVILRPDLSGEQRESLRTRLAGVPGVFRVVHESPAEAWRRLGSASRHITAADLPESFRVTLVDPNGADAFRASFCRTARTGDCADGVVYLYLHPRAVP
ncbi:MAG TPA: permease-like cell division protein FtsX [Actinomycetes bacterium]|nr:permease-like cell division protein FtsX [Actinomycetes bacterium]